MEVKFSNFGNKPSFADVPADLYTTPPENRHFIDMLATEPPSDTLYQHVADRCFSFDRILGQFKDVKEIIKPDPRVHPFMRQGLFEVFSAAWLADRAMYDLADGNDFINRQFAMVCLERYAQAVAIQHGRILPRRRELGSVLNHAGDLGVRFFAPNERPLSDQIRLQFNSELLIALAMRDTLSSYEIKNREQHEVEQLKRENDGLLEQTQVLRTYQVKPALVAASGAGAIRDWMAIDWEAYKDEIETTVGARPSDDEGQPEALMRIFGTRRRFLSSTPLYEVHGSGEEQILRANFAGVIEGAQSGDNPDAHVQLSTSGQLLGMRGTSFEEFAARLGRSYEYELLRGEILSIFCDLVIPATAINALESVEAAILPETNGRPRDVRTIRRLVLARLRFLKTNGPEVVAELKREQRRRPGLHSVIGFTRALPRGSRATAEKREQCRRDLGRELAPFGETYVQAHTRGGHDDEEDRNIIQSHRAIRRNVGGAVINLTECNT